MNQHPPPTKLGGDTRHDNAHCSTKSGHHSRAPGSWMDEFEYYGFRERVLHQVQDGP